MGCKGSKFAVEAKWSADEADHDNTFHDNLLQEKTHLNFFEIYEIQSKLGKGSVSRVWKIKKNRDAIGGSSREEYVKWARKSRRRQASSGSTASGGVSLMRVATDRTLGDDSSQEEEAPGIFYAAKEMHPHLSEIEPLKKEIQLLKRLDHPHIIKCHEVFDQGEGKLMIVLELCHGGDLASRLPYSEQEAANIMRQILKAVKHLHQHNIVHRDLKMENIMFSSKGDDAVVKLIDFGLSAKYIHDDHFKERVGTLYAMSPEAIEGSYSSKTDLWSAGVIAYMLLSGGVKPFGGLERFTAKEVVKFIFRCKYSFDGDHWSQVSDDAKDFIRSLLKADPNERLSAEDALKHPWLDRTHTYSSQKLDQRSIIRAKSSMIKYSKSDNDLFKLGMNAIAKKSTVHETGNLHEIFHMFDTGHDGFLTLEEFRRALAFLNVPDDELRVLFEGLDVNKNNVITFTEFLAATLLSQGRIGEHRIAEAFDHLDTDDSGFITHNNLRRILGKRYDPAEVKRLIQMGDSDGDGRISYKEFKAMFDGNNYGGGYDTLSQIDLIMVS
uniref:Calmodulin n=1 Tax=Grammatophora oceanica TaxID=210454 RepID=A0A7S1VW90_9STRA|mmetsp:Transcript_8183/g.11939  ORF Transcript_8183/g.11939 Transcript_8183/m.11939 type:complete len:552 (+) Transcript_8183:128-1783(+)|eukprot:CAMPEP_0194049078 /NCGR_PEP_ID=MMETSP0009_2-20130614/29577_1 /TAXON_ID=210454 /ORGANISM="Grammatophora oceanica, Strain CCMP 410" /LENGTH=551 /DNA_ID=CAMNT_0038695143 /DNA_START=63 /DNA_END=1718 /DNA_ORIENTATION=+